MLAVGFRAMRESGSLIQRCCEALLSARSATLTADVVAWVCALATEGVATVTKPVVTKAVTAHVEHIVCNETLKFISHPCLI